MKVRGFNLQLSPDIGYFFADKFAGGSKIGLGYSKVEFGAGSSKSTKLNVGPFLRYYFLHVDNRINIFTQGAYEYIYYYGNNNSTSQSNLFTFSAGPVVYLNTNVGVECSLNYELLKQKDASTTAKTFYINVGFQIHLEKNSNQN